MSANVVAIDLGTTGVKVAVIDDEGVVRASAGEVLPIIFTDDGGAEQDPHGWWTAIGDCSRRAVALSGLPAESIGIVAVTSQYTSTVAVDRTGHAVGNVVMWMDGRGARFNHAHRDPLALARWLEIHGMVPMGNDDIGHVSFLRAQRPDLYAAAFAFVEPMDHIAARLTGHVTATQNTMFPMLCVDNRSWGATVYDEELLAMSTLDAHKLPPLVAMGEPRGRITDEGAAHLGIATSATVMDATIDSVTSAVGTGALDASTCGLIIGTTSVMVTHVASQRHDIAHALTSAPSPLPQSWFLVAENGIGGKALDVFVHNIVHPDDGLGVAPPDDAFERTLAAAATSPAGANGVLFLPWLVGSMAPGAQRRVRGGFVNMGLDSRRVDLARAVLEGVALNAAWLLPSFCALAGASYDEISFGGGGASSSVWGQVLADCTGLNVRRLSNSRTTNAHGAALLALQQAGHIAHDDIRHLVATEQLHEPDPGTRELHARRLGAFIDFHERAVPFYDALNSPESRTP